MDQCDKVNLLKLQGQYMRFIVEGEAELNILEHIEECTECQDEIIDAISNDTELPDYGNLFQREFKGQKVPQYSNYEDTANFMKARIQWRKNKLRELIEEAEMELSDLETRLES
jgi:hypothetical protein